MMGEVGISLYLNGMRFFGYAQNDMGKLLNMNKGAWPPCQIYVGAKCVFAQ